MDFQAYFESVMSKAREERLANSPQLLFGELILKLKAIENKDKEILFDFGARPCAASSWRGSYKELGLEYSDNGGGMSYYEGGEYVLPEKPTANDFLSLLEVVLGKTVEGYKGGEYVMHKGVAVYVSNYGENTVDGNYIAPVDVVETDEAVTIITSAVDY